MPKFYIVSGELQKIVDASCPEGAILKALNQSNGEIIDYFTYVSEKGFRGPTGQDTILDTETMPEWCIWSNSVIGDSYD